jgi:hypothetical protein
VRAAASREEERVSAETVFQWAIGFLVIWGLAVVAYAFWQATSPAWNPAPPEPIELHHHGHGHDHGGHGHGQDDHGHGH